MSPRTKIIVQALVLLVSVPTWIYLQFRGEELPDSTLQMLSHAAKNGPEARAWLRDNSHPLPLAGNRFRSADAAAKFVDELYEVGAKHVAVAPDNIRSEPDHGGPYADALVVVLPTDQERRESVVRFAWKELARNGTTEAPEMDHGFIFFWWD